MTEGAMPLRPSRARPPPAEQATCVAAPVMLTGEELCLGALPAPASKGRQCRRQSSSVAAHGKI